MDYKFGITEVEAVMHYINFSNIYQRDWSQAVRPSVFLVEPVIFISVLFLIL